MRIVQVLHGWPPAEMGGTGLYVEALSHALRDLGHAVAVAHPAVADAPGILHTRGEDGIERVALGLPAPLRWEEAWRRSALVGVWRRWLRSWAADVVHVQHLSGLPPGLLAASRDLGARVVLSLHDYALPCARGQLVDRDLRPCPGPAPARCAACLREHLRLGPGLAVAGGWLSRWPALRGHARDLVATSIPPPGTRQQGLVQARLETMRAAIQAADVVLSPSRDLARRFVEVGMVAEGRVQWTALPLLRAIPPAPPAPAGPVRFLFASSILPTKGPHLLLEAFQRLPAGQARLTLAGPAPPFDGQPRYAERLREQAAQVPGVSWRGALPAEAIPSLLAEHDVLVLPSLWPENSPLIVREAAAAGLPVIASRLGGASELVPEALLVEPGDIDELHRALEVEAGMGRRRLPAVMWPTPLDHARWMLDGHYRPSA